MATHSSVLAWRIPGTEEPGGLPSMGSHSRTRLKRRSSSSSSSSSSAHTGRCIVVVQPLNCIHLGDHLDCSMLGSPVLHCLPAAAAAKLLQSCLTVWPHRRQPTRLPRPWDSPGKNTGVGCHFLLQCMKVKSQSEVVQSCPTLHNPMDCSLPGSSVHGIF